MNSFCIEFLFHNDITKSLITLKGTKKSVKLMRGHFKHSI